MNVEWYYTFTVLFKIQRKKSETKIIFKNAWQHVLIAPDLWNDNRAQYVSVLAAVINNLRSGFKHDIQNLSLIWVKMWQKKMHTVQNIGI